MTGLWHLTSPTLTTTVVVIISSLPSTTQDDGRGGGGRRELGKINRPDFLETNPKTVEGYPVFEGDILLTEGQRQALKERKGLTNPLYRWTEDTDGFPLVPYVFGDDQVDRSAVREGMAYWTNHTCIQFRETTNIHQPHLRYIRGSGCYSYVGRQSSLNGQPVSIGNYCNTLGIVVHEIGHAIGFTHEQSRHDRDSYVTINSHNVIRSHIGNFLKYSSSLVDSWGVAYDYSSDMHYGPKAFTSNGKATISSTNPLTQGIMGQRSGLSHRDKLLANKMYNCIGKWMANCGLTKDPCGKGGYLGSDCGCVCPPGASGAYCEHATGGYYDGLIGTCTEKITKEGLINSPNYPNRYNAGEQCVKWIVSPECHVPRLTFSSFRLYDKRPFCGGREYCCYYDSLEIRTHNVTSGDVFCSRDIKPGQTFTAAGPQMVLYFHTLTNYHTGFSAALTFIPQPGCLSKGASTTPATTTTTPATITTPAITTTTPAITTTDLPRATCLVEKYNNIYYWTSPYYGERNYPNQFRCGVRIDMYTGVTEVKLISFNLQPKVNKVCVDYLRVGLLYGRRRRLCGRPQPGEIRSIKSAGYMDLSLITDHSITAPGFNLSISFHPSICHRVIVARTVGETSIVFTPRFGRRHTQDTFCHYLIIAPIGRQVRIDYLDVRTRFTKACTRDWALVNTHSEADFPPGTSSIYCGERFVTSLPVSSRGRTILAYSGTRHLSRGMMFRFTIV